MICTRLVEVIISYDAFPQTIEIFIFEVNLIKSLVDRLVVLVLNALHPGSNKSQISSSPHDLYGSG